MNDMISKSTMIEAVRQRIYLHKNDAENLADEDFKCGSEELFLRLADEGCAIIELINELPTVECDMIERRMRMNRNLDEVYFRVKRDEKYQNVCFTDLTAEERDEVCKGRSLEWFKSLVYYLADRIQNIGEELDIVGE